MLSEEAIKTIRNAVKFKYDEHVSRLLAIPEKHLNKIVPNKGLPIVEMLQGHNADTAEEVRRYCEVLQTELARMIEKLGLTDFTEEDKDLILQLMEDYCSPDIYKKRFDIMLGSIERKIKSYGIAFDITNYRIDIPKSCCDVDSENSIRRIKAIISNELACHIVRNQSKIDNTLDTRQQQATVQPSKLSRFRKIWKDPVLSAVIAGIILLAVNFYWPWLCKKTNSVIKGLYTEKILIKDKNKFNVIVAKLEDDTGDQHGKIIVEGLRDIEWIDVYFVDKEFPTNGADPQKNETAAHENARKELKRYKADLMIIGKVIKYKSESEIKLLWVTPETTFDFINFIYQQVRYRVNGNDLRLPTDIYKKLTDIFRLKMDYLAHYSGQLNDKDLMHLINKYRNFVESMDYPDRAFRKYILATMICTYGEKTVDKTVKIKAFNEAAAIYYALLKDFPHHNSPPMKALVQLNLGKVLMSLAYHELNFGKLDDAVHIFEQALQEPFNERNILVKREIVNCMADAKAKLRVFENKPNRFN